MRISHCLRGDFIYVRHVYYFKAKIFFCYLLVAMGIPIEQVVGWLGGHMWRTVRPPPVEVCKFLFAFSHAFSLFSAFSTYFLYVG